MFNMIILDESSLKPLKTFGDRLAGARRAECWAQEAMWHYMSGSTFEAYLSCPACWDYFSFSCFSFTCFLRFQTTHAKEVATMC